MSNEQLKHIFDNSTCLNRRQMKDYVSGIMTNEESHAVEVHLNTCPFCNDAVEGLFEQQEGNAVEMLAELDSDFLKDHFSLTNPQIHLNSLTAPAQAIPPHTHYLGRKKKQKTQPLFRSVSIAAALLLCFAILWYMQYGRSEKTAQPIAQNIAPVNDVQTTPEQRPVAMADEPAANVVTPNTTEDLPQPSTNGTEPRAPQQLVFTDTRDVESNSATDAMKDEVPAAAPAKKQEEVVVTAYKVPLIDKYEPGSKTIVTSEQIEKMATRTTEGVAATAPGVYSNKAGSVNIAGGRSDATGYQIDGVQVKERKTKALLADSKDNLLKAATQYSNKEYSAALASLKGDMESPDAGRRQQANLLAARCHIALGNKEKARKLLQNLADNGSGSEKRQARRLLRDLE